MPVGFVAATCGSSAETADGELINGALRLLRCLGGDEGA